MVDTTKTTNQDIRQTILQQLNSNIRLKQIPDPAQAFYPQCCGANGGAIAKEPSNVIIKWGKYALHRPETQYFGGKEQ